MSFNGEGLGKLDHFFQSESLTAEYHIFLSHHESLQRLEEAYPCMPAIQQFCLSLEDKPEVMRSLTRLYSVSQSDFYRAMFCSWFSLLLASRLCLDHYHRQTLFIAGLLQDIGKYVVDDSVARFIANVGVQQLPVYGHHAQDDAHPLLSSSFVEHQFPGDEALRELVLHHHARADGTGYPNFVLESQLALDDQILIIANELADRLEKKGSYAVLHECLASVRLSGLLYFRAAHSNVLTLLDQTFTSEEVGLVEWDANKLRAQTRQIAHRRALLHEFMEAIIGFSAELIPYDFDWVVRGVRSNIERLAILVKEVGLEGQLADAELEQLASQEILELQDVFLALPETLCRFQFSLKHIATNKQYQVDKAKLNDALACVERCIHAYSPVNKLDQEPW